MLVDERQERQAEREQAIQSGLRPRSAAGRVKHIMDATLEQIVLIAKVHVKRRLADVGTIEDLLHGDRRIRLLAREPERLATTCSSG